MDTVKLKYENFPFPFLLNPEAWYWYLVLYCPSSCEPLIFYWMFFPGMNYVIICEKPQIVDPIML